MKKTRGLAVLTICLVVIVVFSGCVRLNKPTTNGPTPNIGGVKESAAGNEAQSFVPITEEEAKTIALEKAGLKADEVRFDRVERDFDNGVEHYEVEFRKGFTEYSADIAMDGTIIGWEMDND